jgi:hypothetical protein
MKLQDVLMMTRENLLEAHKNYSLYENIFLESEEWEEMVILDIIHFTPFYRAGLILDLRTAMFEDKKSNAALIVTEETISISIEFDAPYPITNNVKKYQFNIGSVNLQKESDGFFVFKICDDFVDGREIRLKARDIWIVFLTIPDLLNVPANLESGDYIDTVPRLNSTVISINGIGIIK